MILNTSVPQQSKVIMMQKSLTPNPTSLHIPIVLQVIICQLVSVPTRSRYGKFGITMSIVTLLEKNIEIVKIIILFLYWLKRRIYLSKSTNSIYKSTGEIAHLWKMLTSTQLGLPLALAWAEFHNITVH